MPHQWFTGTAVPRDSLFGPDSYDPDPALVDAVNMALYLDMPLLLTGEPGTGKTQLAEKLALDLEVDLHRFETRSVSQAQDLLYQFDPVARLHAAQLRVGADKLEPLRFIEYGPLGRAILQGLEKAEARKWFADGTLPGWCDETTPPRRAVVLIDEIDKAPTDFPNDLLTELERHEFCVREHKPDDQPDAKLKANPAHRPIVIITAYEYRIRAYNSTGDSAWSTMVRTLTPPADFTTVLTADGVGNADATLRAASPATNDGSSATLPVTDTEIGTGALAPVTKVWLRFDLGALPTLK